MTTKNININQAFKNLQNLHNQQQKIQSLKNSSEATGQNEPVAPNAQLLSSLMNLQKLAKPPSPDEKVKAEQNAKRAAPTKELPPVPPKATTIPVPSGPTAPVSPRPPSPDEILKNPALIKKAFNDATERQHQKIKSNLGNSYIPESGNLPSEEAWQYALDKKGLNAKKEQSPGGVTSLDMNFPIKPEISFKAPALLPSGLNLPPELAAFASLPSNLQKDPNLGKSVKNIITPQTMNQIFSKPAPAAAPPVTAMQPQVTTVIPPVAPPVSQKPTAVPSPTTMPSSLSPFASAIQAFTKNQSLGSRVSPIISSLPAGPAATPPVTAKQPQVITSQAQTAATASDATQVKPPSVLVAPTVTPQQAVFPNASKILAKLNNLDRKQVDTQKILAQQEQLLKEQGLMVKTLFDRKQAKLAQPSTVVPSPSTTQASVAPTAAPAASSAAAPVAAKPQQVQGFPFNYILTNPVAPANYPPCTGDGKSDANKLKNLIIQYQKTNPTKQIDNTFENYYNNKVQFYKSIFSGQVATINKEPQVFKDIINILRKNTRPCIVNSLFTVTMGEAFNLNGLSAKNIDFFKNIQRNMTPLGLAVLLGNVDMILLLLAAGANPNTVDNLSYDQAFFLVDSQVYFNGTNITQYILPSINLAAIMTMLAVNGGIDLSRNYFMQAQIEGSNSRYFLNILSYLCINAKMGNNILNLLQFVLEYNKNVNFFKNINEKNFYGYTALYLLLLNTNVDFQTKIKMLAQMKANGANFMINPTARNEIQYAYLEILGDSTHKNYYPSGCQLLLALYNNQQQKAIQNIFGVNCPVITAATTSQTISTNTQTLQTGQPADCCKDLEEQIELIKAKLVIQGDLIEKITQYVSVAPTNASVMASQRISSTASSGISTSSSTPVGTIASLAPSTNAKIKGKDLATELRKLIKSSADETQFNPTILNGLESLVQRLDKTEEKNINYALRLNDAISEIRSTSNNGDKNKKYSNLIAGILGSIKAVNKIRVNNFKEKIKQLLTTNNSKTKFNDNIFNEIQTTIKNTTANSNTNKDFIEKVNRLINEINSKTNQSSKNKQYELLIQRILGDEAAAVSSSSPLASISSAASSIGSSLSSSAASIASTASAAVKTATQTAAQTATQTAPQPATQTATQPAAQPASDLKKEIIELKSAIEKKFPNEVKVIKENSSNQAVISKAIKEVKNYTIEQLEKGNFPNLNKIFKQFSDKKESITENWILNLIKQNQVSVNPVVTSSSNPVVTSSSNPVATSSSTPVIASSTIKQNESAVIESEKSNLKKEIQDNLANQIEIIRKSAPNQQQYVTAENKIREFINNKLNTGQFPEIKKILDAIPNANKQSKISNFVRNIVRNKISQTSIVQEAKVPTIIPVAVNPSSTLVADKVKKIEELIKGKNKKQIRNNKNLENEFIKLGVNTDDVLYFQNKLINAFYNKTNKEAAKKFIEKYFKSTPEERIENRKNEYIQKLKEIKNLPADQIKQQLGYINYLLPKQVKKFTEIINNIVNTITDTDKDQKLKEIENIVNKIDAKRITQPTTIKKVESKENKINNFKKYIDFVIDQIKKKNRIPYLHKNKILEYARNFDELPNNKKIKSIDSEEFKKLLKEKNLTKYTNEEKKRLVELDKIFSRNKNSKLSQINNIISKVQNHQNILTSQKSKMNNASFQSKIAYLNEKINQLKDIKNEFEEWDKLYINKKDKIIERITSQADDSINKLINDIEIALQRDNELLNPTLKTSDELKKIEIEKFKQLYNKNEMLDLINQLNNWILEEKKLFGKPVPVSTIVKTKDGNKYLHQILGINKAKYEPIIAKLKDQLKTIRELEDKKNSLNAEISKEPTENKKQNLEKVLKDLENIKASLGLANIYKELTGNSPRNSSVPVVNPSVQVVNPSVPVVNQSVPVVNPDITQIKTTPTINDLKLPNNLADIYSRNLSISESVSQKIEELIKKIKNKIQNETDKKNILNKIEEISDARENQLEKLKTEYNELINQALLKLPKTNQKAGKKENKFYFYNKNYPKKSFRAGKPKEAAMKAYKYMNSKYNVNKLKFELTSKETNKSYYYQGRTRSNGEKEVKSI